MRTLSFNTLIKASPDKIWQVLWNDTTYPKWTRVFKEGSHAVSDWKEGSKVHFLSPDGGGMYSIITDLRPGEYMAFKHLGVIKGFEEQPEDEETKKWSGVMETYFLEREDGATKLRATFEAIEEYIGYFKETFPMALELVKDLAEQPIVITVEALIKAPVEKIWEYWTTPKHIIRWNNASSEWHTPRAENDLRTGGMFLYRMEARDGSSGFDFRGRYDRVKSNEFIECTLGDGRKVKTSFHKDGNRIRITEAFEAEETNSLEMQKSGWQSILDNFKHYAETNP